MLTWGNTTRDNNNKIACLKKCRMIGNLNGREITKEHILQVLDEMGVSVTSHLLHKKECEHIVVQSPNEKHGTSGAATLKT